MKRMRVTNTYDEFSHSIIEQQIDFDWDYNNNVGCYIEELMRERLNVFQIVVLVD